MLTSLATEISAGLGAVGTVGLAAGAYAYAAMWPASQLFGKTLIAAPRPGEVYNLGGGRGNSVSMIEAIAKIEELTGRKMDWKYVDENRKGDHICYISNLAKLKKHYPKWGITRGIDAILEEMTATARAAAK